MIKSINKCAVFIEILKSMFLTEMNTDGYRETVSLSVFFVLCGYEPAPLDASKLIVLSVWNVSLMNPVAPAKTSPRVALRLPRLKSQALHLTV